MIKTQDFFIAFVMDESDYNFYVYLVNRSSINLAEVKIFTGAFSSIDEDLLETSKVVKEKGRLDSNSLLLIDKSDFDELDFVIWYHLDLKDENGNIHQYWFQLPKYGLGYDEKKEMIKILNQEGVILELKERDGETIDEEVKTTNMKSVYHKFSEED